MKTASVYRSNAARSLRGAVPRQRQQQQVPQTMTSRTRIRIGGGGGSDGGDGGGLSIHPTFIRLAETSRPNSKKKNRKKFSRRARLMRQKSTKLHGLHSHTAVASPIAPFVPRSIAYRVQSGAKERAKSENTRSSELQ